jgi:hypothetical protein
MHYLSPLMSVLSITISGGKCFYCRLLLLADVHVLLMSVVCLWANGSGFIVYLFVTRCMYYYVYRVMGNGSVILLLVKSSIPVNHF